MYVSYPRFVEVLISAASIMIRVLIGSGQFMAEIPTNEQRYTWSTACWHSCNGLNRLQLGG